MQLSRRDFLRAAGLVSAAAALGDGAVLGTAGRVMASYPAVAVARTGAAFYVGPGNVDYRLIGTLTRGQRVTPLGVFGDFARVIATSYRTPAGALIHKSVSGYVLRSALGRLPVGLPTVPLKTVPWTSRPLIAPSGPLVMPSVGMLLDGYKDYIMLDGTWYAARDFTVVFDAGFVTHAGAPSTSASGLVLQNATVTHDASNIAQLTLLHNGTDHGWFFGYSPGTDWEFFDHLPIASSVSAGQFTISVDGTGRLVTLGLPSGQHRSYRLIVPLFRRGDVLNISLSDSPYTDMTTERLSLSLAPLGKLQAPVAPYGSLRALAPKAGITVGTGMNTWRPGPDPRYEQVATSQFDLLVPEGEFNWDWLLRPDATHYDFAGADEQVHFAQRHGMAVRAYLLPSGNGQGMAPADAPWLTPGAFTRDQLLALVHDHIDTVVGRYAGQVGEWLVMSETIFQGQFVPWNFWLNNVGLDFIDQVFTWAHEADPSAKLLYEFSSDEWAEPQASAIYNHLADLRGRGIPVDNVGFEMHVFDATKAPTYDQLLADFRRYAGLGMGLEITEMDVNVYPVPGTLADKYAVQAQIYGDALSALLESGVGRSFTPWDFVDSQSWLLKPAQVAQFGPAQAPLPFDGNYQPKPAYFALLDVLKQQVGFA
ncbi:MAG: endo-1,4-beta-xylanase [Chloroflexi bacterium]|nr:endo-1,4-beta-xylanase [Chloroflexota bacterium]